MSKEEIERRLIEGIRDNYTLNLAISILEDLDIANKKLDKINKITPLELAKTFHLLYESFAPSFGYETREETRKFDENSNNGKLMIAVCEEILSIIGGE